MQVSGHHAFTKLVATLFIKTLLDPADHFPKHIAVKHSHYNYDKSAFIGDLINL